jgi:hypothetical protein
MSTGNRKIIMFLWSKVRRVRRARQCVVLNISQPYRSPRPVTGIAFAFMSDYRQGFGFVIWFIEYLKIVTTSIYVVISNPHILQFATARTECSQSAVSSPAVTWWRILLPVSRTYRLATISQLTFYSAHCRLKTQLTPSLAAILHQTPLLH